MKVRHALINATPHSVLSPYHSSNNESLALISSDHSFVLQIEQQRLLAAAVRYPAQH